METHSRYLNFSLNIVHEKMGKNITADIYLGIYEYITLSIYLPEIYPCKTPSNSIYTNIRRTQIMTKYSHRNKVCNSLIPRRRWKTTPRLFLLDLRARRPRLWRRGPRGQAIRCVVLLIRGEISFNTGGSFVSVFLSRYFF